MACRHLTKPRFPGNLGCAPLVVGKPVPVQERDCHAANAGIKGFRQRAAKRRLVKRLEDGAVGPHPLRHLDRPLVEGFRKHHVKVEEPGRFW